jgi:Domain of unknown function (DUF5018)
MKTLLNGLTLLRLAVMVALVIAANCTNAASTTPSLVKSSLKSVTKFTTQDGADFVIDDSRKLISAILVVVGDVDLQNVFYKPVITVSDKATISPGSGVQQDFIKPVVYTVTAEDGTQTSYTAEVVIYNFTGQDSTAAFDKPGGAGPQPIPWTYLVPSPAALLSGTWELAHSGSLEIRQVGNDQVLTLLEQTPTTQTVMVKVNDNEQPPTQSTGAYGWNLTLNPDNTFTGTTDQGDSSAGRWDLVDLGRNALNRYELKLDGTTTIADGPTVSGITIWYITSVSPSALTLTRDPIITSSSTTSFAVTLNIHRPSLSYSFSSSKPAAGRLTLAWTWGAPPYQVQFKETLSDAWREIATVNEQTYTATAQGLSGFYRVVP